MPYVVATVVKVSGSTYRRPGARVLITGEGTQTGLISGGCFESELMERAIRAIETGKPATVTFDTTSADDLIFGLGLGCTGVAHILLEPYRGNQPNYLDFIAGCIQKRVSGLLVSIYQPAGGHLMIDATTHKTENIDNAELIELLLKESRAVTGKAQWKQFSGPVEALIERISLPLPLVIFGAGPDAVPLVRYAKQLGWHVTIVDKRPTFARADRFPDADAVILTEPEQSTPLEPDAVAVVMTHHFETDAGFLKRLLDSNIRYIGLLGPKAKAELLLQKLRDEGTAPTEEQRARIFAPVGLDIGAETPEEIALSIVSEIQAICSGYSGGSLKHRAGPIHIR